MSPRKYDSPTEVVSASELVQRLQGFIVDRKSPGSPRLHIMLLNIDIIQVKTQRKGTLGNVRGVMYRKHFSLLKAHCYHIYCNVLLSNHAKTSSRSVS